MVFDFIIDNSSAKINNVRFMKSEVTITKLRDILYNEHRYEFGKKPRVRPLDEIFSKFKRDTWKISVCGYSYGSGENVFISKQDDRVWKMIVPHVDASGRVPTNVSRELLDLINV
jgi:hypothetical protein